MRVLLGMTFVLLTVPQCAGLTLKTLGKSEMEPEQMMPDQIVNEELGVSTISDSQIRNLEVQQEAGLSIQVLALGDSITKGGFYDGVKSTWPMELQKQLNKKHAGNKFHVKNLGANGAVLLSKHGDDKCSMDGGGAHKYRQEPEWAEVKKSKASILLLAFGVNDAAAQCGDKAFRSEFEEDYVRFVTDVQKMHPNAAIYLLTPLPLGEQKKSDKHRFSRVNSVEEEDGIMSSILQRVTARTKANMIDVAGPARATVKKWIGDDGMHVNANSVHVLMAKTIAARISADSQ